MLSSVLFWVLQVKTKLPIDLPLNEKYFFFYVDFFKTILSSYPWTSESVRADKKQAVDCHHTFWLSSIIVLIVTMNVQPNLSSTFLMRSRYLRTRKRTRQMTILDEDSICAIHCSRSTQRSHLMVICRLIDFDLRERYLFAWDGPWTTEQLISRKPLLQHVI